MDTDILSQPKFSLIVLCYRSEESIVPFVDKINRLFNWVNLSYELILVGNYWENSLDKTPEIIKQLAHNQKNIRTVTLKKEGAMGWDMKSGIQVAQGEYIGIIDGDGQFPIDTILPPLYQALEYKMDIAKTYRVVRGDGVYRLVISFIYNMVFKVLFGTKYRDINSKPKIIKKEILQKMNLESNDWFIDAEIMIKAKRMNLKVAELPVHFLENKNRISFVKVSAIWEFIVNLCKYRFSKLK